MSINAIGGAASTAATQASQYRSASSAAAAKPAGSAPPDGKAFVSAIASALQDIGVADAGATDSSADPASALGDFLNELMESLHGAGANGGGAPSGPPPGGAGGPPPPGGGGGGSGGGGMKSELASLVGSLARQSGAATEDSEETDSTDSTESAGSTDSTAAAASTDTAASTGKLESSFGALLGALGLDSSDSSSKLGQFLQTLASKLDTSGPAGNLINTTA